MMQSVWEYSRNGSSSGFITMFLGSHSGRCSCRKPKPFSCSYVFIVTFCALVGWERGSKNMARRTFQDPSWTSLNCRETRFEQRRVRTGEMEEDIFE